MIDVDRKKVLYKAKYRSTKEADQIIGKYVRYAYLNMKEEEVKTLLEFLTLEDSDILSMFMGKQDPPPKYQKIVTDMRLFSHG